MNDRGDADTVELPIPTIPVGVERPPPFSSLVQVDLAALSDTGKVRPNNEDHYLVVRFGRFLDNLLTNLPEGEVPARSTETGYGMVVADGMGGSAAGEVASRLAIQSLINLVLCTPDWILLPEDEYYKEMTRRAVERFHLVHQTLAEQAREDNRLGGMGTTMTMAYSVGADLLLAHVGDSRCYLFRRGLLCQLTHDHTMAQALADYGQIPRETVAGHRLRHVLTQVLGTGTGELRPEVELLNLEDGDCLLLCTDGLTEMVDDTTIAAVLDRAADAKDACRNLLNLALEAGGTDNVTVLVARYRFPRDS
jgi:PPM family protein phosphatase